MLEVRLQDCLGENAGVGAILVEPQVQTQASALFCLVSTPYLLAAFVGSTGSLVRWFCYISLETLSCQEARPGGTGGCRNSGGLKERLFYLQGILEPTELNPVILQLRKQMGNHLLPQGHTELVAALSPYKTLVAMVLIFFPFFLFWLLWFLKLRSTISDNFS